MARLATTAEPDRRPLDLRLAPAALTAWAVTHDGPARPVDQLQEVSGIGPATYAKLADLVTV